MTKKKIAVVSISAFMILLAVCLSVLLFPKNNLIKVQKEIKINDSNKVVSGIVTNEKSDNILTTEERSSEIVSANKVKSNTTETSINSALLNKDCTTLSEEKSDNIKSKTLFNIDVNKIAKISVFDGHPEKEPGIITEKSIIKEIVKNVNDFTYVTKETSPRPGESKGELAAPGFYAGLVVKFFDNSGSCILELRPSFKIQGNLRVDTKKEILDYYTKDDFLIDYSYFQKFLNK